MHRELASRSFTDALLRLAGDRVRRVFPHDFKPAFADQDHQTTHQQVKSKILERIAEWSRMFSNNTELGIMEQAYMKLKSQSMPTFNPDGESSWLMGYRSESTTSASTW